MAKKAFLVTFEVTTRAVVDIPDDYTDRNLNTNDKLWQDIVDTVANDLTFGNSLIDWGENVSKIEEDTNCPYDDEWDI